MTDYKLSLWLSNIATIFIAISLAISIKIIFNPLLLQQQQLAGEDSQLQRLSNITNLIELEQAANSAQFNYIKVTNSDLTNPIILKKDNDHHLFTQIFPIETSTLHSLTTDQVFEYSSNNDNLFKLYRTLILIIFIALMITMLICNLIYYRLFRKIERSLVDEISNDSSSEMSFIKVSAELNEQKRIFHNSLRNQEKKIEQLARQVNMDNLTGLNNRHAFRKDLTKLLSDESNQKHAILSMIRLCQLPTINAQRGFQQGDEFVISMANIVNQTIERYHNIHVYRVSGSEFALIAHGMTLLDAQHLSKELKSKFDQYQLLNQLECVAFNGMSSISSGQLPEQVLARTDQALAKAEMKGENAWVFEETGNDEYLYGQNEWQIIIKNIIEKRSLILLHQPIQAIHHNMKGYEQISTRFIGENDNIIATDTVFAMAQRTDLMVKLDIVILETVVSQCRHHNNGVRWGLNITSSAIQNSSFIVWLERLLLREPNIAASLIFEMQENVLDSNLVASKRIFDMLKRVGSRSAICNFGKGIASFRLFKELNPDFIKIDASLITNIELDSANQQFIRMIVDVAHRMDCRVIAEGIEHIEQKQILENMYIDGIQGFLIARPTPL